MNEPTYTAPRVTPADIEAQIVSEHYFMASDALQMFSTVHLPEGRGWFLGSTQLLTICILQLRNGFVVTGESACASPENFNAEKGREIARAAAVTKCWALLGYELRTRLAAGDVRAIAESKAWTDCASVTPPAVPVASAEAKIEIVRTTSVLNPNHFGKIVTFEAKKGDDFAVVQLETRRFKSEDAVKEAAIRQLAAAFKKYDT